MPNIDLYLSNIMTNCFIFFLFLIKMKVHLLFANIDDLLTLRLTVKNFKTPNIVCTSQRKLRTYKNMY